MNPERGGPESIFGREIPEGKDSLLKGESPPERADLEQEKEDHRQESNRAIVEENLGMLMTHIKSLPDNLIGKGDDVVEIKGKKYNYFEIGGRIDPQLGKIVSISVADSERLGSQEISNADLALNIASYNKKNVIVGYIWTSSKDFPDRAKKNIEKAIDAYNRELLK